MDEKWLVGIAGTVISILFGVVTYFVKREMGNLDKEKEKKSGEEEKLGSTLNEIGGSLVGLKSQIGLLGELQVEVKNLKQRIELIDKENNGTRNELNLLSEIVKPLFEKLQDVNRNSADVRELLVEMRNLKDKIKSISSPE